MKKRDLLVMGAFFGVGLFFAVKARAAEPPPEPPPMCAMLLAALPIETQKQWDLIIRASDKVFGRGSAQAEARAQTRIVLMIVYRMGELKCAAPGNQ